MTEHSHNQPTHTHPEHKITPTAGTLTTFVVLALLTVVALGVGFSEVGPWKPLVSLLIAVTQAAVLSYFFMDLKQADKLTWLCAGAAVFWTGLMFLFIMTDHLTRHLAAM